MYAVEFETNITDGVVKIPDNYRRLQSAKKAKVLILVEDDEPVTKSTEPDFIEWLSDNPVQIDKSVNFLSREEANER